MCLQASLSELISTCCLLVLHWEVLDPFFSERRFGMHLIPPPFFVCCIWCVLNSRALSLESSIRWTDPRLGGCPGSPQLSAHPHHGSGSIAAILCRLLLVLLTPSAMCDQNTNAASSVFRAALSQGLSEGQPRCWCHSEHALPSSAASAPSACPGCPRPPREEAQSRRTPFPLLRRRPVPLQLGVVTLNSSSCSR